MQRGSAAVIKVKKLQVILGHDKETGVDVVTITIEFHLADKLEALELLGRHLGIFKDGPPVVQISLAEVLDMLDCKKVPKVA